MATTSASSSPSTSPSWHSIGVYVQLGGAAAFVAGAILSVHHYAIGICFIAGAAAFYAGKKLKGA